MATRKKNDEPSVRELVSDVIADLDTLIGQHVTLLRSEVQQNIQNARDAALSFGTGAGLLAGGGVLATLAAVHGLHRLTRWPLWACYGVAAGAAAGAGLRLLGDARERAAHVTLAPSLTAQTLKEDVTWLQSEAAQALK